MTEQPVVVEGEVQHDCLPDKQTSRTAGVAAEISLAGNDEGEARAGPKYAVVKKKTYLRWLQLPGDLAYCPWKAR